MTFTEKLHMAKFTKLASSALGPFSYPVLAGLVGGAAAGMPYSTVSRMRNHEGWRGFGAGQVEDTGRSTGIAAGGLAGLVGGVTAHKFLPASDAAKKLELDLIAKETAAGASEAVPAASRGLKKVFGLTEKMGPLGKRLALLGTGGVLAGGALGGWGGDRAGKALGNAMFHPGPPPNAWEAMKQKFFGK